MGLARCLRVVSPRTTLASHAPSLSCLQRGIKTMAVRLLALAPLMMTTLLIASAVGAESDPGVGVGAQSDPAVGVWQVYSDKNDGSSNGLVRTYVQDGKLVGVVDALPPDAPPNPTCTKCSGTQKDKPVLGLVIMWGFEKEGDSWTGGTILEPQTGTTYKCKVHFAPPDSLKVRGYVGVPLFGRSQTWKRVR